MNLWKLDASARNGFSHNQLNRLSERRDDVAFIQGLLQHPRAKTLLLAGDVPLLPHEGAPDGPLFPVGFAMERLGAVGAHREMVFLGLDDQDPVFVTLIEETETVEWPQHGLMAVDLRKIITQGMLPPALLGALAQAKSVLHWHKTHRFCSKCGQPTRMASAGWRRECDNCGTHHFPRTDPVVIMLAVHGDACLLGRQPRFPAGMYSCLAGFLEPGETIEDSVRRELWEEAGVRAGQVRYISSQTWPFPASLMIGCFANVADSALKIDHDELEDARWFSRTEALALLQSAHKDGLTCPPPMAIAHQLMKIWAEGEAGA